MCPRFLRNRFTTDSRPLVMAILVRGDPRLQEGRHRPVRCLLIFPTRHGMQPLRQTQTILLLLWVLVSSVGVRGSQQPNTTGVTGAIQDYLNQTATAILALKSARFVLKREGAPIVLDEKKKITFTSAACAYSAPDRVSCNVKVSLKDGTIVKVKRVWVPEGAFQSNPLTQELGKSPADSFNPVQLFAATGIPEVLRT